MNWILLWWCRYRSHHIWTMPKGRFHCYTCGRRFR